MNKNIQDKIFAYIAAKGPEGATPEELAREFLAPTGAPPAVFTKLVGTILSGDPRVTKRPDGRWAMLQVKKEAMAAPASPYTVVEVTEASVGAGSVILDVGVIRVDELGRMGNVAGAVVKPDPWPQGLVVPPQIKEEIKNGVPLSNAVERVVKFSRGATIVCWRAGEFHHAVSSAQSASGIEAPVLSLQMLAKRLAGIASDTPESLAAKLGIPDREPLTAREQAQFTAELFGAMLQRRTELDLGAAEGWVAAQRPKKIEADFSGYEFDRGYLETLPETPGIYLMRDAAGRTVYVGKAMNLRDRVKSYFRARVQRDEKTERIQESVSRVDVVETGSDLGALLAEHRAIQEMEPPINIQYEVHDRPAATKVSQRRIVIILPSTLEEEAEVFLVHGAKALRRMTVSRDEPEELRPLLQEFFFSGAEPKPQDDIEPMELQIVWSWLERHQDKVNAFDVDLAGGLAGSLTLLERYLREEESAGRVFHI